MDKDPAGRSISGHVNELKFKMAANKSMHSLIKVRSWRTASLVFIKSPDNILENYRPVRFTSALGNLTKRIIKNAVIKKKII